jgi:hypothetical protein
VFISDYEIADKRFRPVFGVKKVSLFSGSGRKEKFEKVYINQAGWEKLKAKHA